MALTFTEKTGSYDNVDRSLYTTGSVTPSANKLLVLDSGTSGTNPVITAVAWTGGGAAWTLEKEDNGAGRSIGRWRYQSASPPGANTIDITVGGTGISGCAWTVTEVDGHDTSGTNGSGAFVQSVSANGTGTTGNATLAAYTGANSRPLAAIIVAVNAAITPELTGATNQLGGSPATSFLTEWSTSTQDTTPSFSWTGSNAWRSVASEIKMAAGGTAHTGSVTFQGVGNLTPTGALGATGSVTLQGVGNLTPTGSLGAKGTVTLQGVGILTADAAVTSGGTAHQGTVTFQGVGTLAADGAVVLSPASYAPGTILIPRRRGRHRDLYWN